MMYFLTPINLKNKNFYKFEGKLLKTFQTYHISEMPSIGTDDIPTRFLRNNSTIKAPWSSKKLWKNFNTISV